MSARRELTPQEALTGLIAACINDPELFFIEILRVKGLRRWQRRACRRIKARLEAGQLRNAVHVRSCHGAGKTWFVAGILLWFEFTRPLSRGLTTAPTWKQVEDTLWRDVAGLYNGSLLAGEFGRLLATKLEFGGVWFASGVSSDHMENVEGQHSPTATIRVVDEAKAVPDEIYVATKGIFTSPEILDFWISTPSIQSGQFYERDMSDDESVIRIVVDVDELISDESIPAKDRAAFAAWKSECARDWGETSPEYISRVLAQYVDNAEGALFPASWVERATKLDFEVAGPLIAGMDVAGSEDGDQNAVAVVAGPDFASRLHVRSLEAWNERDTMVSKGRAIAIARPLKAPFRVDTAGLGKGVVDSLRQDDYIVDEYWAAGEPRDPARFLNLKAEDSWYLRDLLEKGLVRILSPNHKLAQKVKSQFAAIKYKVLQSGKIQYVKPNDSPDLVEAIIIACAGRLAGEGFYESAAESDEQLTPASMGAF